MVASEASDQWSAGPYSYFHGGSNENIGGLGRLWWTEISLFWFELIGTLRALDTSLSYYSGVLVLEMQFAVLQKQQTLIVNKVYCRWKNFSGVIDTDEQFIDTGDNIFPWCHWYHSEITKKPKIYRRY